MSERKRWLVRHVDTGGEGPDGYEQQIVIVGPHVEKGEILHEASEVARLRGVIASMFTRRPPSEEILLRAEPDEAERILRRALGKG